MPLLNQLIRLINRLMPIYRTYNDFSNYLSEDLPNYYEHRHVDTGKGCLRSTHRRRAGRQQSWTHRPMSTSWPTATIVWSCRLAQQLPASLTPDGKARADARRTCELPSTQFTTPTPRAKAKANAGWVGRPAPPIHRATNSTTRRVKCHPEALLS